MSLATRPPRAIGGKSKSKVSITASRDWHASLGGLILKAEKAPDSLERMLAVCRAAIAFLVQILKPGSRFIDTPTVILGQHYLSHRDLGEQHRGDVTRVYVQELCSYDPVEEPITPPKYLGAGHVDVAKWSLGFFPKSHARVRKEGLIGSGLPYIEVELDGPGFIEFPRHAESYAFTLPSLILTTPLSDECPLDYDGSLKIVCEATGLRTEVKFRAWREAVVKGDISRLAGDGEHRVAKIEGHWDSHITVHGVETQATGVLWDTVDMPPTLRLPIVINLARPGPQMASRLWSAVIEALLYTDESEAAASGKKAAEIVAALPEYLKGALLYEVPEGPRYVARNNWFLYV